MNKIFYALIQSVFSTATIPTKLKNIQDYDTEWS